MGVCLETAVVGSGGFPGRLPAFPLDPSLDLSREGLFLLGGGGGGQGAALARAGPAGATQELGAARNTESPDLSSCFVYVTPILKRKIRHLLHATPKSPRKVQPGSMSDFFPVGPCLAGAPGLAIKGSPVGSVPCAYPGHLPSSHWVPWHQPPLMEGPRNLTLQS